MASSTIATIPTLDAHCDSLILREVRDDPLDLTISDDTYHVDLERLRRGGVDAVWIMVGDSDMQQSLRLIDGVHEMAAAQPDTYAVCTTAAEVRQARRQHKTALLMSIEGQVMFAERVGNVRNWHRLGVRMFSLTHGEARFGPRGRQPHALQHDAPHFGYMTHVERTTLRRQTRGLTPFARESVKEVARLGAITDLAHCNDNAFWEVLELTDGPVCASHACCAAVCPHARNLTDEMMRALAQRGGVIGICLWGPFVDEHSPTLERVADHFMHAIDIMGPDHVGLGTDYDGIDMRYTCVIPDPSGLPALWHELEQRGVPRTDLAKIAGENFLNLLG